MFHVVLKDFCIVDGSLEHNNNTMITNNLQCCCWQTVDKCLGQVPTHTQRWSYLQPFYICFNLPLSYHLLFLFGHFPLSCSIFSFFSLSLSSGFFCFSTLNETFAVSSDFVAIMTLKALSSNSKKHRSCVKEEKELSVGKIPARIKRRSRIKPSVRQAVTPCYILLPKLIFCALQRNQSWWKSPSAGDRGMILSETLKYLETPISICFQNPLKTKITQHVQT